MKWLFSIGIIGILAFQSLYLPIVSVYLESHRAEIAEKYCIYKFQPELMCAGSCYINSALEEAVSQTGDQVAEYQGYLPLPLYVEPFDDFIISIIPQKNLSPLGPILNEQNPGYDLIDAPPWT